MTLTQHSAPQKSVRGDWTLSTTRYEGAPFPLTKDGSLRDTSNDVPESSSRIAQCDFVSNSYLYPITSNSLPYAVHPHLPVLDESHYRQPKKDNGWMHEVKLPNHAGLSHLSQSSSRETFPLQSTAFAPQVFEQSAGLLVSKLEQEITVSRIEELCPTDDEVEIHNNECAQGERSATFDRFVLSIAIVLYKTHTDCSKRTLCCLWIRN